MYLLRPLFLFYTTVVFMVGAPALWAAPSGGNITSGGGNIKQAGTTTTVTQATERLGVNWQTFNVNTDETVNFVQPSASSIAVNRILGNNGSSILGNETFARKPFDLHAALKTYSIGHL